MADPEALRGTEFQRGTHFLKINRITLSYGLASIKDETFILDQFQKAEFLIQKDKSQI